MRILAEKRVQPYSITFPTCFLLANLGSSTCNFVAGWDAVVGWGNWYLPPILKANCIPNRNPPYANTTLFTEK